MTIYRLLAKIGVISATPLLIGSVVVSSLSGSTDPFVLTLAFLVALAAAMAFIHAAAWWLMQ